VQLLKVFAAVGFCLVKETQQLQVSLVAAAVIIYFLVSCKRPLRVSSSNWIQIVLSTASLFNCVTVMMVEYGNIAENPMLETSTLRTLLNAAGDNCFSSFPSSLDSFSGVTS
jgi:hypothetical protein